MLSSQAVSIQGLTQLRRYLKAFAPAVGKQFQSELKGVADIVARDAAAQVPVVTGSARDSIRSSTSGSWVQVRAGGTRAPYYPWLDFGGTLRPTGGRHNTIKRQQIKGGRYLYPAVGRNQRALIAAAENAVRRIGQQ